MMIENYTAALARRRDRLKKDIEEALSRPAPDWALVRALKARRVRLKDRLMALRPAQSSAA